jgi:Zn-dependent protease with chaperone function
MEVVLKNTTQISCPNCSTTLPVHHGYTTWCDQCNWNMQQENPVEPRNLFEKIYMRVGIKSSESLLNTILQNGTSPAKFSGVKLLTYFLAACVHIVSVGFFTIGCFLIGLYYPSPLLILTGLACIIFGWVALPKGYKPETPPLSRKQFPILYQTIDEISAALHTRKVDGIIVDGKYNAGYAQMGFRRRPIIHLGLPLVSILDKQELVAIISHELAHGINGDFQRGFFVNSAIRTLVSWYDLITPDRLFNTRDHSFFLAVGMIIPNLLMLLLSNFIVFLLFLICNLNWRDSQRAEFWADRCAAVTAGKVAAIQMLNKFSYGQLFDFTVLKFINSKGSSGSLIQQFQQLIEQVPDAELERIKRINLLTDSKLNVTHPPTANRISFIQSMDSQLPLYQMTDEIHRQLLNELSKLAAPIESKIVDDVKSNVLGY